LALPLPLLCIAGAVLEILLPYLYVNRVSLPNEDTVRMQEAGVPWEDFTVTA